jgi:hypothetical protein
MTGYYEKVDFDQEVWVFYDILTVKHEVLRDVCHDLGDPDGKYWADGCELFKYRPNRQYPRSVVATFETEAEAEHAYWLTLLDYVTTTDNMPLIHWDASSAAACCGELIKDWDGEDVGVLRYWLRTLENVCEAGDLDQQGYVDMSDLGGAPIPDDVDTGYPVWAMDAHGEMLVGNGADDIEHVDQFRRLYCGGFKHHEDAVRSHDLMGGWILIEVSGRYQVYSNPSTVKDLRGQGFIDECERQQCWDETLLKEAA